jgi:type IV pilus assembly protein PilA
MDGAMARNKGFTLIELMAVVSIVSILAVIAIPAYLDYVTRSKVSEGMVFVAEAKTSVSEYYYNIKKMPVNNAQAGLPADPNDYNVHKFIRRLQVSTSTLPVAITVTFKLPGTNADNKQLQLIGDTKGGILSWTCKPAPGVNGIKVNQVPPNCRG